VGVDDVDAALDRLVGVAGRGVAVDAEEDLGAVAADAGGIDLVTAERDQLALAAARAVGDAPLDRIGRDDRAPVGADVDHRTAVAVGGVGIDLVLTAAIGVHDEDAVGVGRVLGAGSDAVGDVLTVVAEDGRLLAAAGGADGEGGDLVVDERLVEC